MVFAERSFEGVGAASFECTREAATALLPCVRVGLRLRERGVGVEERFRG